MSCDQVGGSSKCGRFGMSLPPWSPVCASCKLLGVQEANKGLELAAQQKAAQRDTALQERNQVQGEVRRACPVHDYCMHGIA